MSLAALFVAELRHPDFFDGRTNGQSQPRGRRGEEELPILGVGCFFVKWHLFSSSLTKFNCSMAALDGMEMCYSSMGCKSKTNFKEKK